MYTARYLSFKFVLSFAWKPLLVFFCYASAIVALYEFADLKLLALPFTPIGLVGTAVAFYVGFKNNSSYERLWEARKIWGAIVNLSRTYAVYVIDYLEPSEGISAEQLQEHKEILVHRHIGYINALRIQLRQRKIWELKDDPFTTIVKEQTGFVNQNLLKEIKHFLHDDEAERLYNKHNTATHILHKQSEHIKYLASMGCMDTFRHVEIGKIIAQFYDQQGACERIKSYPFPRQYAHFSETFVRLLAMIIPFGLLGELAKFGSPFIWLVIPMSVIISWVFYVMELIGDRSENPFENGVNDIPMSSICRTIEIDLREMLNEQEIPARLRPEKNILM